MKKFFKICLFSLFIFILFALCNKVEANSISKISMDIYVDKNGDASVTEVWNCYANQGTEVYHPYYNLGNSKIQNLTVSEEDTNYTTLSSWKTSGTLDSKAYKCGINRISNGVELCWGISKYGSHTYTVKYNITNFVSELTDSQMIYWTLIPYDFSSSIGNVYIKIYSDFSIADTVDVWGYGNTGTAYVYDGYIEMQSDGKLPTSDYMTILVKFPQNTFNAQNKLNYNFNHYFEMAEEGAIHNSGSSSDDEETNPLLYILLLPFTLLPYIIIVFVILAILGTKTTYDYGTEGKSIPRDVAYFRDIPSKKDIFRGYYIGYQYGIIKSKTDILGAIILKWLKDSIIRIEQKKSNFIFKKENTIIVLNETNPSVLQDTKEQELFYMLYAASKDGILENKEFERWCSKSYSKILSWFDKIISREKQKLINEGLIIVEKQKRFKLFTRTVYKMTSELKKEALELAGLKRYLLDYTLIKDREAIEVHLFEEYLMYAQMLGIAKTVAKQFKDLYPEIIEQSSFNSYDNILFVHMCASSGISHANSAKSRAESYSSGGGGFSSSGGGGGSFGGGGGRRRFPLKINLCKYKKQY